MKVDEGKEVSQVLKETGPVHSKEVNMPSS